MGIRWDAGMIDDEPTLPLKQRTALYNVDHRSNNPLLPPPNPPFPPSPIRIGNFCSWWIKQELNLCATRQDPLSA